MKTGGFNPFAEEKPSPFDDSDATILTKPSDSRSNNSKNINMPVLNSNHSLTHSSSISPPKTEHPSGPAQFQLTQVFYDQIPVPAFQHTQSHPAQQRGPPQKPVEQAFNPFDTNNSSSNNQTVIQDLNSKLQDSNRKVKELEQQNTNLRKEVEKQNTASLTSTNQYKDEIKKLGDLVKKSQDEVKKLKDQQSLRELEIQKDAEIQYQDLMKVERRKADQAANKVEVLVKENNELLEQVSRMKDKSYGNAEREEMLQEIASLKREYQKLKFEMGGESKSPTQNGSGDQIEVYRLRKQLTIQTAEIDELKKHIAKISQKKPDEEDGIFQSLMGGIMGIKQAPEVAKLQKENSELKAKLAEAEETLKVIFEGGNAGMGSHQGGMGSHQGGMGRGMFGN